MKTRKGLNVVRVDGETIAQLYDTIIYKTREGKIVLNAGGWRTNHTKNCMNDLLPDGYKVYQRDFVWFVVTPDGELEFNDNMELEV